MNVIDNESSLSELIEGLYEAALDPDTWNGWFDCLMRLCDSTPTCLMQSMGVPTALHGFACLSEAPGLLADSSTGTDFLRRLAPHLQQAVRINELLQIHTHTTRQLLETFPVGVLLLDRSGDVLMANRLAERYLEEENGLSVRDGVLYGHTPTQTSALHEAFAEAFLHPHRPISLQLRRPSGFWPLRAMMLPLRATPANELSQEQGMDTSGYASLALFVSLDEECFSLNELLLQNLYSLTPTEARVSALLARGLSSSDIAEKLKVQPNTVRIHLKSVYGKTHTHSQTELVRLLLTSPALYAR